MTTSIEQLMVTADHAVIVEPAGGTATLVVNSGNVVYYNDNPTVDATHNIATIAVLGSVAVSTPVWLKSAGLSSVTVTTADATPTVAASGSTGLTPTGGDDSVQINAAISTRCDVLLGPGTFLLNTATIGLPRNGVGIRVRGSGRGATTLKLSATAPRAFDLVKVADYDTYQNITLEDMTIDCNNVNGALGDHVILGYGATGTLRFNVNHLRVRRVDAINIPTDATQVSSNRRAFKLYIVCGSSADTAMSIQDVIVEDCRATGGNTGFVVQGFVGSGAAPLTIDEIHFRNLFHDSGIVPSGFFAANNFEIGGNASCGRVTVDRCWGRGSGDVGMELDGINQLSVTDCLMEDAWTWEYFCTNFQAPKDTDTQILDFQRCRARHTRIGTAGVGFSIKDSGVGIGPASLDRCEFVGTGRSFSFSFPETVRVNDFQGPGGLRFTSRDYRVRSPYHLQVMADAPTSFWELDDPAITNTVAIDSMNGANNGTYVSSPSLLQAGIVNRDAGSSVSFASASSQKLTLPGPALGATGTVEFWFKWTAGGTLARDNTGASGYILGFDNTATFAVRVNGTTINTSAATTAVRDGNKHHLVVTVTGTTCTIFLDGIQVGTSAYTAATSALPWHISENGTAAQYADATFAKIAMYPTALSATRVLVHYNAGK